MASEDAEVVRLPTTMQTRSMLMPQGPESIEVLTDTLNLTAENN